MRQDARALLEKLKQSEFEYREFDSEPIDDGETWPLLEAVREHPQIAPRGGERAWPKRRADQDTRDSATQGGARLFGRYDGAQSETEATAPQAEQPSLSSLLRRLSDDN